MPCSMVDRPKVSEKSAASIFRAEEMNQEVPPKHLCLSSTTHYHSQYKQFLGVYTTLQKVTISFVMSLCLPVHPSVCVSIHLHGTTQLPSRILMKIYEIMWKIWYSQTGHRQQYNTCMCTACWITNVCDNM